MRKVLCLSILAGLAAALAGCRANRPPAGNTTGVASVPQGNDRQEINPAPAPSGANTKPVAADGRPLLVCFGDSLTAGQGTDPGQSYPDYLQADLDRLGYRYSVVNEGVSGATTKDGVERLPEIAAMHPAVVVVEFGGNDGLRGLRIEDTRANLDQIVAKLQEAGAKVALAGITLPPDYGPDYIAQFNETYRLLAGKYHVPMLPFLLQGVYGEPGMMQADRTHATAQGNIIVAGNVLKLLVPTLHKR